MDGINVPVLMKKGAEADLYLTDWHERKVVLKKRLPKKYRQPALDSQIRGYRTVHEPLLMHEARRVGVPTPLVFLVDVKNATIVMEFVEGRQVKQVLNEAPDSARQQLCFRIGRMIGLLHESGLIHGDLTTSNMILGSEGKVFFVDFGLGERSEELEAKGVDLHLMQRALQSTHFRFAEECFASVIQGYAETSGEEAARSVLDKVKEIERRGRYVADRRERG